MVIDVLHALLPSAVFLPERLGKVCRRAIYHTPPHLLVGGLLGEGETGQLAIHHQASYFLPPASSLFAAAGLTNTDNNVQDGQEATANIDMTASHISNRSFFIFS